MLGTSRVKLGETNGEVIQSFPKQLSGVSLAPQNKPLYNQQAAEYTNKIKFKITFYKCV